jgi:hypothetical protein
MHSWDVVVDRPIDDDAFDKRNVVVVDDGCGYPCHGNSHKEVVTDPMSDPGWVLSSRQVEQSIFFLLVTP